jgi:hypothetical protein
MRVSDAIRDFVGRGARQLAYAASLGRPLTIQCLVIPIPHSTWRAEEPSVSRVLFGIFRANTRIHLRAHPRAINDPMNIYLFVKDNLISIRRMSALDITVPGYLDFLMTKKNSNVWKNRSKMEAPKRALNPINQWPESHVKDGQKVYKDMDQGIWEQEWLE